MKYKLCFIKQLLLALLRPCLASIFFAHFFLCQKCMVEKNNIGIYIIFSHNICWSGHVQVHSPLLLLCM